MYRPRGLTKAQWEELRETCRTSDKLRVGANLHTLDDDHYRRLPKVIDGQVDGAGYERSGTISFLDPGRKMHDVQGVNARHYMVRIEYGAFLESTQKWVDWPVATGAVDTCSRDDAVVTVTFRGKAILSQHAAGEALTIPKGVQKTEAIKRIMEQRGGERRGAMNIPDRAATLNVDYTVRAIDSPWAKAVQLAHELDLMLFYDPAGFLTARPHQTTALNTFRPGKDGWLTAEPKQTYDFTGFHNEVWVWYGDKGREGPYKAECPPSHPLSPQSLGRKPNGVLVPCRRILVVHRPHIKRLATAKTVGDAMLERELELPVRISGESYPFPFIEDGDPYRVDGKDFTGIVIWQDWTLPLTPGEKMTLGLTDVRSWWPGA